MKKLGGLVDNLNLPLIEKEGKWLKDLSNPSDAVICGLVFAALPNLHTLELYAKPFPKEVKETIPYKPQSIALQTNFEKGTGELLYQRDVLRLSQGLAMTHITSLRLSNNLNGLHTARLPSLKMLDVDFSDSNQFVTVGKGCFTNVETLKIRCKTNESFFKAQQPTFSQKLNILLKGLPSVRTLEFESGDVASWCLIPAYIETVKFRMANSDALGWVYDRLDDLFSGTSAPTKLKLIEVNWVNTNEHWSEYLEFPEPGGLPKMFRDLDLPRLKDFDGVHEGSGIRIVVIGGGEA
jgi:hypothetical protein